MSLAATAIRTAVAAGRRRAVTAAAATSTSTTATTQQWRSFADGKMPFGLDKILGEPDNLIATERERRTRPTHVPEFAPELKKDFDELGIDGIEELDELEEKNMEGYNDLGLVPPEGSGTFASPILIPSRMASRQVGYCDPETHAMYWFTIHHDSNTYYIKDLGLFFKMLPIPDDEASAHH
mmetsp:Transcript_2524/g.5335  ORF Transcript_2524/g.5335 Transcript_2524/m.5335 type:complete len:181 (-) Transcript_2524:2-544(-)